MRTETAMLSSVSPYSQSRFYEVDKLAKEGPNDYEARTWRERMHVDEKGNVFIPPMCFKNCLSDAAKYLSVQIPGKGKSTYTKHIEAGILIVEGITLDVKKDDVPGEWLFVPASGRRGDGKRVKKCFPVIRKWSGELTIEVLDETVTHEVLDFHLSEAGRFIGVGRFRPRNNGFYGRFKVDGWK
jgi:hypothetical protein